MENRKVAIICVAQLISKIWGVWNLQGHKIKLLDTSSLNLQNENGSNTLQKHQKWSTGGHNRVVSKMQVAGWKKPAKVVQERHQGIHGE